ncbi:hypothetical protein LWF15_31150 [Kineosporia rhizophila]|uniref:hypothetical protein n=1 Tax=Kineosporia rhizophila TaxID=84633 RepID=UPI001E2B0FEC|nr:hypothetical protein [Kineosporia rhizophila]MCE0539963.1 hypothetical protein [Kineosporia rhizophila]
MTSFLAGRTVRWSLGAIALCLVLLVAAWFLLITPRRDDAAALRDQAVASQDQASLLEIKLAQLKSQAADLPEQKKKLKEIAKELPPDADIPAYLRTLDTISGEAGVGLTTVTPGTPVLVTLATAAADTGAATTDATGLGAPGDLVSIPMNLELGGDYYQLSSWLKSLQSKVSRSYMITAFTLTANEEETSSTAGLVGAQIADGDPAATATTSSSAKGQEGVVPTATATDPSVVVPTTDATSTATATATDGTGTGTTGTGSETYPWTLSLTGTVFVLLTEDSTLEDVKADAAAAQASLSGTWTEVTPSPTATASATASAGATTAPTATATDPNVGTN